MCHISMLKKYVTQYRPADSPSGVVPVASVSVAPHPSSPKDNGLKDKHGPVHCACLQLRDFEHIKLSPDKTPTKEVSFCC